jgi:hypothetical protein
VRLKRLAPDLVEGRSCWLPFSRYEAERAERRYRSVEPENRLVARGLETDFHFFMISSTTSVGSQKI